MAKKVKLSEMTDMFKGMEILSLEGVKIEGDIEIDLSGLMGGGGFDPMLAAILGQESAMLAQHFGSCLLYTSDAADDLLCVDLGGRRIIKKKKQQHNHRIQ